MPERAWLMLAYGEDRAYGGNEGYSDSPDHYSYDSRVPNWRQVTEGDLAVIAGRATSRGAPVVTGFARVERIDRDPNATKIVRRCPVCGHPRFKARQTKSPRWRCDHGHEFDHPTEEIVAVTAAVAWFGDSYRPAIGALSPDQLKAAQLHRRDGNSIRPLDESVVWSAFRWDPALNEVVDPAGYPDPEAAAAVNRAAVPVALEIVRARYPEAEVTTQDHGNPGFDFLVKRGGAIVRYVELKTTTKTPGTFYMSEYQREFSELNRARYSLLVLSGFDIAGRAGTPNWYDGAVTDHFGLAPIQWRGTL
jgi:hypothetical protein